MRTILGIALALVMAGTVTAPAAPRGCTRRECQQRPPLDAGARPVRLTDASRHPAYADRHGGWSPARTPATSATGSSTMSARISLESGISQWGWAWGQFIDHDMGLRDGPPPRRRTSRSTRPIHWRASGTISVWSGSAGDPPPRNRVCRTPASRSTPSSSFLDASQIYGIDPARRSRLLAPDGASRRCPTDSCTRGTRPALRRWTCSAPSRATRAGPSSPTSGRTRAWH